MCLALRLIFVFSTRPYPPLDESLRFDEIGWNLVVSGRFADLGKPRTVAITPLYPFFLSLFYRVFGRVYEPVYVAQAVVGCLTLLLLYWIAEDAFRSKRIGLLSMWLAGLFPGLVGYTKELKKEILMAFFCCAAVLLLIRGFKSGKRAPYFFAGVCVALVSLLRPITLLFPFWIFPALIVLYPKSERKKALIFAALFSLGAVLPVLPWTYRNRSVYPGRLIPVSTGGGLVFWNGQYPPAKGSWILCSMEPIKSMLQREGLDWRGCTDPPQDRVLFREGLKLIRKDPISCLRLYVRKIYMLWVSGYSASLLLYDPDIGDLWTLRERAGYLMVAFVGACKLWAILLLALAFSGGLLPRRGVRDRSHYFAALMLLYFTANHALLTGSPRLMLPVWPLMILYASAGIDGLYRRIRGGTSRGGALIPGRTSGAA